MRPRTEALLGVGALLGLALLAAALGQREGKRAEEDPRSSTFLTGPLGARGLADGLERLGLEVRRSRRSLRSLALDSTPGEPTALVLIDPTGRLSATEAADAVGWADAAPGRDLVLAGEGAEPAMRCFGYGVAARHDSVAVRGGADGERFPWVAAVLAARGDSVVADSSRTGDLGVTGCTVPPMAEAETLLTSVVGRVVALRLHRADRAQAVTILSDSRLLRNRGLRETAAGPFALRLFAGRYRRVLFEESHHGFGEGGSLWRAVLRWSRRSPWGWAVWQASVVGLLALLAGAVRFGPVRHVLVRRRRSPLEHVRALATALAAARGHDVAIGAIVGGLHRRLVPAGQRPPGDWRPWLERLRAHARTPRAREAVEQLLTLTQAGQPAQSVHRAAHAVEDLWQEMHP